MHYNLPTGSVAIADDLQTKLQATTTTMVSVITSIDAAISHAALTLPCGPVSELTHVIHRSRPLYYFPATRSACPSSRRRRRWYHIKIHARMQPITTDHPRSLRENHPQNKFPSRRKRATLNSAAIRWWLRLLYTVYRRTMMIGWRRPSAAAASVAAAAAAAAFQVCRESSQPYVAAAAAAAAPAAERRVFWTRTLLSDDRQQTACMFQRAINTSPAMGGVDGVYTPTESTAGLVGGESTSSSS